MVLIKSTSFVGIGQNRKQNLSLDWNLPECPGASSSLSELPKTFQDAVKVTRELGVLYLWIDSLCIIQYGDGGEDWKRESGRMENVFSYAYCTIAATATVDANSGFLERDTRPGYVHVQHASGK